MIDAIIVSLLSLCIMVLIILISVNVFQGFLVSEEAEDTEIQWHRWQSLDDPEMVGSTVDRFQPAFGRWQRISEEQYRERTVDNIGRADRWEDPRDTRGGQTDA